MALRFDASTAEPVSSWAFLIASATSCFWSSCSLKVLVHVVLGFCSAPVLFFCFSASTWSLSVPRFMTLAFATHSLTLSLVTTSHSAKTLVQPMFSKADHGTPKFLSFLYIPAKIGRAHD